jgi:hypothetical protein
MPKKWKPQVGKKCWSVNIEAQMFKTNLISSEQLIREPATSRIFYFRTKKQAKEFIDLISKPKSNNHD